MDEYEQSYSRMETLITAGQTIRECLVCTICLDFFTEPVTIKCGHKFCKRCILQIASNESSTCPLCNIKIQKRSIPKETNELIQASIEKFKALAAAIKADSGIDVFESCKKVRSTKECVPPATPSTSRIDQASAIFRGTASVVSQRSVKSKIHSQSNKRLSLKKKQTDSVVKTTKDNKNTLDKYWNSPTNYEPDRLDYSNEKVIGWLEKLTPADGTNSDSNNESIPSDVITPDKDSKNKQFTQLKESQINDIFPKTYSNTSRKKGSKVDSSEETSKNNETNKYKEVQMRVQEAEMIAKKKKSNQNLLDQFSLKTPPSIPATSHSDAYDWRRVKHVGKEMQVKTYKSLNVSVERSASTIVLDDTVPCNSTNNDSKNISRESDSNTQSINSNPVHLARRKSSITNNKCQKNSSTDNVIIESSNIQKSMNHSSGSEKENTSLSTIDQKHVNEIIGVNPVKDHLSTPEETRNTPKISNQEKVTTVNHLSPLKTTTKSENQENNFSDDDLTNSNSKNTVTNCQSSPSKRKLSLKMKLTSSKPVFSQPRTPDKINRTVNESPKNVSPDRPKSKLSLRLPNNKTSDNSPCQSKSPVKNEIHSNKRKPSSNKSSIVFKKLGRISKKRKPIPFLCLGKMRPKEMNSDKHPVNIIIKSNIPANIDYKALNPCVYVNTVVDNSSKEVPVISPEEDSQLKFLSVDSPHSQHNQSININKNEKENNPIIPESNESSDHMEIDNSVPEPKILKRQLDFRENIENNQIHNKSKAEVEPIKESEVKPSTSTCVKSTPKNIENNDKNNEKVSEINLHASKRLNMPTLLEPMDIEEDDKNDNNSDASEINQDSSPVKAKPNRLQEDVISVSSNDSEPENFENRKSFRSKNVNKNRKHKNRIEGIDSNTDSDASIYIPKSKKNLEREKSVSSSSLSSLKTSPLKKKRTHSESSNDDDDDVTSIIGKWCNKTEKPVNKKPKFNVSIEVGDNPDENADIAKILEDFASDDIDVTLVNENHKPFEVNKPQNDPPIDDIIKRVKSFKENEDNRNKLVPMPSSLQSADLFDTNEQNVLASFLTSPKLRNKITDDHMLSTPSSKHSDKENLNISPNYSDLTMVDLIQFNNKPDLPEELDGSNKENNAYNQIEYCSPKTTKNVEDQTEVIESSQNDKNKTVKDHSVNEKHNTYYVSEDLMCITQEQQALKKIEKELIGFDLSNMQNVESEAVHGNDKSSTPPRKPDDDFDTDNIDATPIAKRRHPFNFPPSKSNTIFESNESENISPENSMNLIPAITPVRNTKSYPLCHSTPMINVPEKKSNKQSKNIVLICSGLQLEATNLVQAFAKKFNAKFQKNFNMDVTHVIVQTDPENNAGQKTFKYMQGIAFKKYVISFQWIMDCMDQNILLDEDEEKYEVLDPDNFESGSKRSRMRTQDIFDGFAFYCREPFNSFSLNEFKDILRFNGAVVAESVKELSQCQNKWRIVTFESEDLNEKQISLLKKSQGILVSFEWIVDCISQYHLLSLLQYLYETTAEEAVSLGFPLELLAAEESVDEEEEEDEEVPVHPVVNIVK